jgi:hypothetical protein
MTFRTTHLTGFGSWNNFTVVIPASTNPNDAQDAPGPASASIVINSNGTGSTTNDQTFNWVRPAFTGVGQYYEARMTVSFGSTPTSGTMDSWVPLSTNRTWELSISGNPAIGSSICALQIRQIGSSSSDFVAEATSTVTFSLQLNVNN